MFSLTNPGVVISTSSHIFLRPPNRSLHCYHIKPTQFTISRSSTTTIKANIDEKNSISTAPVIVQEEDDVQSTSNKEVKESVELLKEAAKTKKVAATEIISAFKLLEKAKLDPSKFCETLGGSESPGRTWMLIFTAEKGLKSGKYFPITAVQRFDAAARRIENGVYLGPLGCLTFEGRFSWKKRILAFVFELLRIKIGPFNPIEINIKGNDESEPTSKNPFFIWLYIDEEIAVARGRSGGTAFWCRCQRVISL
ncbi:uncharacterized protein LOC112525082 [Cynara cardunculus var. scolymus]|uniref:Plastid lipid-associated protein/fibrillin conserved domain-containing protein n=1 Tax=Cynara cardunculus var. scolymus TaxID=59895 RepID=A0A103Y8B4_CYNCS|nr:uncharacterized protein LOC112525082 [Cynara cardunculus var. scolymus]KVI04389.1 hypothetical protein Ccrd_017298 [Cynara cardunculus var. scolymus]